MENTALVFEGVKNLPKVGKYLGFFSRKAQACPRAGVAPLFVWQAEKQLQKFDEHKKVAKKA